MLTGGLRPGGLELQIVTTCQSSNIFKEHTQGILKPKLLVSGLGMFQGCLRKDLENKGLHDEASSTSEAVNCQLYKWDRVLP